MRAPSTLRPPSLLVRWLEGSREDRERFGDLRAHLGSAPLYGLAVAATKLLAALTYGLSYGLSYGWPLLLSTVLTATVIAASRRAHRRGAPEHLVTAALLVWVQLDLAAVVIWTGGTSSPLLPLLAIPVITLGVCFRTAVTACSAGFAAATVVAAGVLTAGVTGAPEPCLPLCPAPAAPAHLAAVAMLVTLICVTVSAKNLARCDAASRQRAHVDALTGLHNRRALYRDFADLQQTWAFHPGRDLQEPAGGLKGAAVSDQPDAHRETAAQIGLILLDLDHFKAVNDVHGHARGDDVLREVADVLRSAVRAEDEVYRVGGEEFVVLVAGADASEGVRIAERLRGAVAGREVAGLAVTLSAGVSTGWAADVELKWLLAEADAALYRAKDAGRDRVACAAG